MSKFVRRDFVWRRKKIISHQDNAPAHKSVLAMGELRDLRYNLLSYPSCSPDLAPSGFHLFPNLKKFVSGKHFPYNEEVERAVDEYFNSLPLPGRNADIGEMLDQVC